MTNPTACRECGMSVEAGEYHPYATCLMFKGCHDSTKVRANLQSVVDYGNTRATEGEAVAWRWRDDVRPGLPWKTTTDADVIDQLRAKGGYEIEPLYTHPPRSGDEARDAAYRKLLDVSRMLVECSKQASDGNDYIDIGLESPLMHAAREAIDAAMAARGGDNAPK